MRQERCYLQGLSYGLSVRSLLAKSYRLFPSLSFRHVLFPKLHCNYVLDESTCGLHTYGKSVTLVLVLSASNCLSYPQTRAHYLLFLMDKAGIAWAGSIYSRDRRFFISSKCPVKPWAHSAPYCRKLGSLFLRNKRPERESNQSPQSSAEFTCLFNLYLNFPPTPSHPEKKELQELYVFRGYRCALRPFTSH
jgi:hypothetical protein